MEEMGTALVGYRGIQAELLLALKKHQPLTARELAARFDLTPNAILDTVLVDASRQRLENLTYFSQVQTVPTDTMIPGRKDLNVIVEEKRTGSFNFGAGFSTIDSLVGFAELQQTNFDLFGWPDFVGGGQRLRIRAQYGIERADAVLSKSDLTEHLYEDDSERDSNVLEVIIGRLRRKIDPERVLNPIETIRGQGYRLRLPRAGTA
jgi:hypothetical protein